MEQKPNTGAIFKNNKKEKETHPDYRGKINVDGVEKEIALWVNTSKNGLQYFSASISEPYVPEEKHEPKSEGLNDLPF
jgi:uncharacterized protein (DUF736 family)